MLATFLLRGRSYYFPHFADLEKTEAQRVCVTCSRFHGWEVQSQHLECFHHNTCFYLLISVPVPSTGLDYVQNYSASVPKTRLLKKRFIICNFFLTDEETAAQTGLNNYPQLAARI